MKTLRTAALFLGCGLLLGQALTASASHPLSSQSQDEYRAPWPERMLFERNIGCPVQAVGVPGCGAHTGINQWAVDMNGYNRDECDEPLRGTRWGSSIMIPEGQSGGYGHLLGIRHMQSNGALTSSWYAHLNSTEVWDSVYIQGDRVGYVDTTGTATGCHLHFQVNQGHGQPYSAPTLNVALSGAPPSTGFTLQTFSNDPDHGFASNNTGAGYCRLNAPATQDPGSPTGPCESVIRDYVRNHAAYTVDLGSTHASTRSACGANRFWVKRCSAGSYGTLTMQNLIAQGPFGQLPRALIENGTNAYSVDGHYWKVWGRWCRPNYPPDPTSKFVYEWLGRPTTEDYGFFPDVDIQLFEGGWIIKDYSNPSNIIMYADVTGVGRCTYEDVTDLNNDPCYDLNGTAKVDSGDQLAMAFQLGFNEWDDPAFNDRYDINKSGQTGWGSINSGDQLLLAQQIIIFKECY